MSVVMPNLLLLFGLFFFLWIRTESYENEPNCGVVQPKAAGRVWGGEDVPQGKYPFMVTIVTTREDGRSTFCGGSIINKKWILTAAHCIQRQLPKVKVGHVNRSLAKTVEAEDYFPYPHYLNYWDHYPDIGLVKLRHPLEYNENISSICLNTEFTNYEWSKAVTMGWGRQGPNGEGSDQLKELNVRVLYKNECKYRYRKQKQICKYRKYRSSEVCKRMQSEPVSFMLPHYQYGLICAAPKYKDTQAMCPGDSGGPLVVKNENRFYTLGVFYTAFCGSSEMVARYAEITDYFDWIDETMYANS